MGILLGTLEHSLSQHHLPPKLPGMKKKHQWVQVKKKQTNKQKNKQTKQNKTKQKKKHLNLKNLKLKKCFWFFTQVRELRQFCRSRAKKIFDFPGSKANFTYSTVFFFVCLFVCFCFLIQKRTLSLQNVTCSSSTNQHSRQGAHQIAYFPHCDRVGPKIMVSVSKTWIPLLQ